MTKALLKMRKILDVFPPNLPVYCLNIYHISLCSLAVRFLENITIIFLRSTQLATTIHFNKCLSKGYLSDYWKEVMAIQRNVSNPILGVPDM